MTTTPKKINQLVKDFYPTISSEEPFYVPIKPERYAKDNDCFLNVEEKVRRDGGTQVIGWAIWYWEGVLIEAEFHSIWKSPEGEYIDITPNEELMISGKVLFLPDPKRNYEGLRVDNVRKLLTDNFLMKAAIEVIDAKFALVSSIQKPHVHKFLIEGQKSEDYRNFSFYEQALQTMFMKGGNKNSPCFCGSGKKIKTCCYKKITKLCNKYS